MSNNTIDTRMSPSMHPSVAERFSSMYPVKTAFETAHSTLTKVHDEKERISNNKKLSLEGQQNAIKVFADSQKPAVIKKFTDATTYLEQSGEALKKRLQDTLTTDDPMAAEIRAHYKSTNERVSLLRVVITQDDLQTISAVLVAPSYLSGLTDTQQANLLAQYYESSQPELANQFAEVEAALQTVQRTQEIIPTEFQKAGGS